MPAKEIALELFWVVVGSVAFAAASCGVGLVLTAGTDVPTEAVPFVGGVFLALMITLIAKTH